MSAQPYKKLVASARTVMNTVPMQRALGRRHHAPISETAAARIAMVDELERSGVLTPEQARDRRAGYRYFGEREAAGAPPMDVTYH